MTPPSEKCLAKYGLTAVDWMDILERQGGHCAVCQEPRASLCVDHVHAKGWKKMPPEQRKLWVRGLLCFWCNTHYVGRGINHERSRRVTAYLEGFRAPRVDRLPGTLRKAA